MPVSITATSTPRPVTPEAHTSWAPVFFAALNSDPRSASARQSPVLREAFSSSRVVSSPHAWSWNPLVPEAATTAEDASAAGSSGPCPAPGETAAIASGTRVSAAGSCQIRRLVWRLLRLVSTLTSSFTSEP